MSFKTGAAGLLEGAGALAGDSVVITDPLGNLTTSTVSAAELLNIDGTIAPLRVPGVGMDYWGLTPPPGFVFFRALTLGNAASGATERANADTERLFTLIWNSLPLLPVFDSAGALVARGASAAADFAAGKRLQTPDKRFRVSAPSNGVHLFGETLGEEDVQLTLAEIPSHNHTTNDHGHAIIDPGHTHAQDPHTHVQDAHTHTQNAHTHTQNAHTHSYQSYSANFSIANNYSDPNGNGFMQSTNANVGTYATRINSNTATNNNSTATNNNSVAVNQNATAVNQNAETGIEFTETATVVVNNSGGDAYHNNVQPTIIVNYIVML